MFQHSLATYAWVLMLVILTVLCGSPVAEASSIQSHSSEVIFAAACSTCHGADGKGEVSWVTGNTAPNIAGRGASFYQKWIEVIRKGSDDYSMPGFGPEEITDAELAAILSFLQYTCAGKAGCPAPTPPSGTEVKVDILDADPWYSDGGADNVADPFDDTRRVVLATGQYLKVINTGRTWHTITNASVGKDSGFIGYAGNLGAGTGYYYANQTTGLAPGCVHYNCKLHPYMQVEVCTAGNTPGGLTRASKVPIGTPAKGGRSGEEIWVNAQSQEESSADSVDGAMQVINAATWGIMAYIPDVGNNPHNAWPGLDTRGRHTVITTSWHDNIATYIDGVSKVVRGSGPVGAASAHVQVIPGSSERWFVTIMGGVAVQEINATRLRGGGESNVDPPIRGQFTPHGIWFCDDGDHYLTANTLANTASLYSVSLQRELSWTGTGGTAPLASSVFNGYGTGGCVRAYTNNAGTPSVSVYDIDPVAGTITRNTTVVPLDIRDDAGNLKLRDTTISPVRWVHLPIQTPVSPADATTHGRFMVTANKASFNVSITALDSTGGPTAIYTFPAGLGAHGVVFGRKGLCDTGNSNDICYYAYVTNTFEDYISVYDLERMGSAGVPGSATETVSLEGFGATALCGVSACTVPITTFCPDCRSGAHVGDVPLQTTTTGKYTYLKEPVWINPLATALDLDLDLKINTGGQGIMVRDSTTGSAPAPPWP